MQLPCDCQLLQGSSLQASDAHAPACHTFLSVVLKRTTLDSSSSIIRIFSGSIISYSSTRPSYSHTCSHTRTVTLLILPHLQSHSHCHTPHSPKPAVTHSSFSQTCSHTRTVTLLILPHLQSHSHCHTPHSPKPAVTLALSHSSFSHTCTVYLAHMQPHLHCYHTRCSHTT
jgi:hypothetical protein